MSREADSGAGAAHALPVGEAIAAERLGDHQQAGAVHGGGRALGDARERSRVHGVPDLADQGRALADVEVHSIVHGQNGLTRDFQAVDVQVDRRVQIDHVSTRVGMEDASRQERSGRVDRSRAVASSSRHAGGQRAGREVDGQAVRTAGERADGAGALVVGAGLAAEFAGVADFAAVLDAVTAGRGSDAVVRVEEAVGLAAEDAGVTGAEDGSAGCAAEIFAVAVFAVFLDAVGAGRTHATRAAGARGATTASAGSGRAAITSASGTASAARCCLAFGAFGVFVTEALAVEDAGDGKRRSCGQSESQ